MFSKMKKMLKSAKLKTSYDMYVLQRISLGGSYNVDHLIFAV